MTAPSPTPTDPELLPDDLSSPGSWWEWFIGTPLRIALIVVISAIALALVRTAIRRITDHVAEGTSTVQKLGEIPVGAALIKADPVATARRAQRARTLGSVLRSTASIVVGGIAFFLVLDQLGINLAPFIASVGIVGVALGFGAQSLVKDFLTGTFMLLEDQYGVGDVVDVGPAVGTVEAVTLRVTKVRDAEGTLWHVPNGTMVRVGNKTQGWSYATVELEVDYFADLDEVRRVLTEVAAAVAADPTTGAAVDGEPTVTGIEKLTADGVTMRVRVRSTPARQWEVARALRSAARTALEEAGIPLAGQRDALTAHLGRTAAPEPGAPEPAAPETTAPETTAPAPLSLDTTEPAPAAPERAASDES
ncbi:mechanosensitive ion channel family protein [Cellulomonas composti]|uniref:Mechanosensitive ion channel protein MscS n=1 Tax=Cellulomonas composti TaxID=266130 RepID=A0A511JDW0_9CELL|nr:mechanosensitive ion channel family protein [Cellulomonas composti]GEL96174.1 mechanosensitive ion channel protein MscS [Cellulomonas composti]